MASYEFRPRPKRRKGDRHDENEDNVVHQPRPEYKLLRASELPSWAIDNPFLRTGYRPISASMKRCVDSLLHVHNETINIYSHLIPAVIAFAGNYFLHIYFQKHYPAAPVIDRLAIHIYLTTSLICFAISSIYHTLCCHSQTYSAFWLRWDFAGITLQITGSLVSGIYMAFYCQPRLQQLYWTMTIVFGLLSTFIVVNPRFQSPQWKSLRTSTFMAMGLSAFLPIVHTVLIYEYDQLYQKTGIGNYLIEGLVLTLGTVFFTTHFPESYIPERFDIFGASHQIFHILVVIGALIHMSSLLSVYDWVHRNPQCAN
ncbi:mPR-like GPCR protein [Xylariaceae sp. FL1019]|nr:mPR-like GPCR protein [Xylariaceae sp. FL1019]